jgi:hypothetical protein
MSPAEVTLHARKKLLQVADAHWEWTSSPRELEASNLFPILPRPENAPAELRQALEADSAAILAGRWKAFGTLELMVDDPPHWHCDYAAQRDLSTTKSAFDLQSRHLPGHADIKLIWELSRWSQLVRLGMAAYVLGTRPAREKCIDWLEDWVKHNPPYRGWNWTSALEVGIRLIQFTWLDAILMSPARWDDDDRVIGSIGSRLRRLREALLPAHVRFAWRYRSFGSSANNHLLGELAGCIVATVRWPQLSRAGATLEQLQACWEREVLKQFAPDGGNREQALNYHLFSFELCWQALKALTAAGRKIAPPVHERLGRAAGFYQAVQVPSDPWDYGDSDSAYVTPFFLENPVQEWHQWMGAQGHGTGVQYWLGDPPAPASSGQSVSELAAWRVFPESGMAIYHAPPWGLRWDVSPLGYLSTAAHGHSDALHLSIWYDGVGLVVDPGTGAYYSHQELRRWLASGGAHNGPRPTGPEHPPRLGMFLWGGHHPSPSLTIDESGADAVLNLSGVRLRRRISSLGSNSGWNVEDGCMDTRGRAQPFTVLWQFAPETQVQRLAERVFLLQRREVTVRVTVSVGWGSVDLIVPEADGSMRWTNASGIEPLQGVVSPGFRRVCRGLLLMLSAHPSPNVPGVFSTAFCEAAE